MRVQKKNLWKSLIVGMAFCMMPLLSVQAEDTVGVTITTPSDGETTIAPGRNFYVLGTFTNGAAIPENATVKVTVSQGENVLREVSTSVKANRKLKQDSRLNYWDPVTADDILLSGMPDLIWDGSTDTSMKNGDSKCYYDENMFAAMIAGGEAVELDVDDQMGFVDKDGNPYAALDEGRYKVTVSVLSGADSDAATVLGTAAKEITIGSTANKVLARFSPSAHKTKVDAFASTNQLRVYNDSFPGSWFGHMQVGDKSINCEILPEWRASDMIEYMTGKVHFVIYNISPTCTAYAVELATLQNSGDIEKSNRLVSYYYQFGEPELPDGTSSDIIPFEAGDKLALTRAELTTQETTEGVYEQDSSTAEGYDLNLSDGVDVEAGETLSIYGVTAPIQLAADDIVAKGDNSYTLKNKIATLHYRITGDGVDEELDKAVSLNRLSGGWDNPSELEFKHDIPITEEMQGKTLTISVSGLDAHGVAVTGSEETFKCTVAKAANPAPTPGQTTDPTPSETKPTPVAKVEHIGAKKTAAKTGDTMDLTMLFFVMLMTGGCGVAIVRCSASKGRER